MSDNVTLLINDVEHTFDIVGKTTVEMLVRRAGEFPHRVLPVRNGIHIPIDEAVSPGDVIELFGVHSRGC